ncbi:MAG TPA: TetR/AcrR family transcriptional regulator [Bacillota bacterium]|nr:TetR/AcrR family transcriptional regulator [Bacillota bacterium]
MSSEEKSVREKIILATFNCIEKEGIHTLTTRSIAKEAGVNSAAINYYFGTKEKLIEEALRYAIDNALGDSAEIMTGQHDDPNLNLYIIFSFFFTGMLRYPGLMKALFYDPFISDDYTGTFLKRFSALLEEFLQKIEPLISDENRAGLKLSLIQMCSSVVAMGLFPSLFQDFLDFDFRDPNRQKEYIDHLFKHYHLGIKFAGTDAQKNLAEQLTNHYMQNG